MHAVFGATLLSAGLLLIPSCRKAPSANTNVPFNPTASSCVDRITTHFVPDEELTVDQQKALVALAGKCGIANVSRIETFYIHPSRQRCIFIKSAEMLDGRKLSYQTLVVRYRNHAEEWNDDEVIASVGEFRARAVDIKTVSLTIFTGSGCARLIKLSDEVPLQTADRMVDLLDNGRIECSDDEIRPQLSGFDFSKPDSIAPGPNEHQFRIEFRRNRYVSQVITCQLLKDAIQVIRVIEVCS